MSEIPGIYLARAEDELLDVKALLETQRYTAAVSRSYYAMFHAAQALLISKGIETYTHSWVSIQFHKTFIKSGTFSIEMGKSFTRILDRRIKSDYEIGFKATKEEAESSYKDAMNFIGQVKIYLEKK